MAYVSSSPAKDVVRDYAMGYMNYLIDLMSNNGMIPNRRDLPTLFLPGSAGLEISSYQKMGIPPESLLGIEQDKNKFEEMKKNGWKINLFNGSTEQLAMDLEVVAGSGKISKRFHLVGGGIEKMLNGEFPYFFLSNLDVYSDIGSLMENLTPFLFTYLQHNSILSVTTYARQDPLSVESSFGILYAILQSKKNAKSILEENLQNILVYTKGSHERANRLLLRELCFLYNLFESKNPTVYCQPFFLFNPEGKKTFQEHKEPIIRAGPSNVTNSELLNNGWKFIHEIASIQNLVKKILAQGKSEIREILSLFKNQSVLDLTEIKDPDTEELRKLSIALQSPSFVYPGGFARIMYSNEVGSPMLTWMMHLARTGVVPTGVYGKYYHDKNVGLGNCPSIIDCILAALDETNKEFSYVNKEGQAFIIANGIMKKTSTLKKRGLSNIKKRQFPSMSSLEDKKKKRNKRKRLAKKSKRKNRRKKK